MAHGDDYGDEGYQSGEFPDLGDDDGAESLEAAWAATPEDAELEGAELEGDIWDAIAHVNPTVAEAGRAAVQQAQEQQKAQAARLLNITSRLLGGVMPGANNPKPPTVVTPSGGAPRAQAPRAQAPRAQPPGSGPSGPAPAPVPGRASGTVAGADRSKATPGAQSGGGKVQAPRYIPVIPRVTTNGKPPPVVRPVGSPPIVTPLPTAQQQASQPNTNLRTYPIPANAPPRAANAAAARYLVSLARMIANSDAPPVLAELSDSTRQRWKAQILISQDGRIMVCK